MKATGMVRRVDPLGRVCLPKELRKVYRIAEGDPVEVFTTEQGILLRKYEPGCVFCGSIEIRKLIRNKPVCMDCVIKISQ